MCIDVYILYMCVPVYLSIYLEIYYRELACAIGWLKQVQNL